MNKTVSEVESILKRSGIASYLPDEVKDRVCHGVAVDIVAYYEENIGRVASMALPILIRRDNEQARCFE